MNRCDILVACTVLVAAAACGDDSATEHHPVDGAAGSGGAASCPTDTPPFEFGPMGLSTTNDADGIKVYLEDASDLPPALDYNDWTIALTDLAGNPLPDAQLTFACAWMGAHGHGSNPREVEKLGDGRYKLIRQNMAMYGGWEIKLWIDKSGAGTEYTGGGGGIGIKACSKPMTDPTLVLKACVPQ